jgi:hypothetical protein
MGRHTAAIDVDGSDTHPCGHLLRLNAGELDMEASSSASSGGDTA